MSKEIKTSIIISHRISTVRMADRIVVLKDGRVLEKGTHEELMGRESLYRKLVQMDLRFEQSAFWTEEEKEES